MQRRPSVFMFAYMAVRVGIEQYSVVKFGCIAVFKMLYLKLMGRVHMHYEDDQMLTCLHGYDPHPYQKFRDMAL